MSTETPANIPSAGTARRGPAIRVFEPALCCNTGVCGTDLDQALVDFTADLQYLQSRGVDITRHNLANDPQAFVNDPAAGAFLRVAGSEALPLVLVDGVTVATGSYPDRTRLETLAGLSNDPANDEAAGEGAAPDAGGRPDLGLSAGTGGACGCGAGGC